MNIIKSRNISHEYHKARLSQIKDFKKIWFDDYFQGYFVKKYMWDLPRASFELFGVELTYQQIDVWNEFVSTGGWKGGRLAVASGHGSGKTKLIGILASLHLLTFYKSITRIQAPTLNQVTNFSFKEITNSLSMLASNRKIKDKIYNSGWGFLLDYIQINTKEIYIKGHKTDWYIEAKTAPKGDSTNLSGQHQLNYLLILDEASGIPDEHIEASLGALSEKYNSCVMFSQHTKLSGKFHEAVTIKSRDKGGIWGTLRLSSRYSPRVDREQLKIWLETYSEDEIRVRIDGLPPQKETGMLLSPMEVYKMYDKEHNPYKDEVFNRHLPNIVFSYDLGYSGYRDSSVLGIIETFKTLDIVTNKTKTFANIIDIQKYDGTNGKLPTEFVKDVVFKEILKYLDEASNKGIYYQNIYVCGDATAGGYEAFTILEDLLLESQTYDFQTKAIQWGSERLYFEDKKRFINGRAKAFVNLRENIVSDRVIVSTDKYRNRINNELSNIPFVFTDKFKYKILSKEEMKKKGLSSPDIADTIAQIYLLNMAETEIIEKETTTAQKQQNTNDELVELESEFDEVEDIENETPQMEFENEFDDFDDDLPTTISN